MVSSTTPPETPLRVSQVWRSFFERPYECFILGWHWKGALFSALVRCAIFLTVNLSSGWKAAWGAALTEFAYRIVASGFYASMTQSFRKAEPAWVAYLTAMVFLPIFQHSIEFFIHWLRGTPKLMESMAASILFTMFSTLYNLYSMRQGTMVVGPGSQSLWRDILSFPRVFFGFLTSGPKLIWRSIRVA